MPTTQVNTAQSVTTSMKPKEQATQSVAVFARLKPVGKGDARGEIKVRGQNNEKGAYEKVITISKYEFALASVFEEEENQVKLQPKQEAPVQPCLPPAPLLMEALHAHCMHGIEIPTLSIPDRGTPF